MEERKGKCGWNEMMQQIGKDLTGWLFQIFFIFTPNLGEMIQFD